MSSFKDTFKEVLEDFGGRIKNPLITSFILVWLYHHWLLVYTLFSFNSYSFLSRVHFLVYYSTNEGFCGMVLCPLGWAFVSLGLYYFIAVMAQLLKILIGIRFNAAIITLFDKGNYVTKTVHNKLKKEKNELKISVDNIEKERDDAKSTLKQKESELEKEKVNHATKIDEKDGKIGELSADLSAVQKDRLLIQDKVTKLEEDKKVLTDTLDNDKDFIYNKTRKAVFQALDYFAHLDSKASPKRIKAESFLLGQWMRSEFHDYQLNNRTEHAIKFNGDIGTDIRNEFLLRITELAQYEPYEIFYIVFKNKSDLEIKELLFKVTNDLIVGKVISEGGDSFIIRLVEYRKIAETSIQ
jgi:hypothetical protein